MEDTNPHIISLAEWEELISLPAVRDTWGVKDESAREFATRVYGVKFKFVSGGPGYVGDLFILQGDALTDDGPLVLRRGNDGLILS